MTRSSTEMHKIAHSKVLGTAVFVIAMISFMFNGSISSTNPGMDMIGLDITFNSFNR